MADTATVLTGGSNSFQTTAEHLNALATDILSDGVVGTITSTGGVAPATGALAVNAQGSPNMTVAVTTGNAYVTATPSTQASQRLRAKIAAQNVTIAANATGSTRYDWIYVKIDPTNANTPNVAGDNVASIVQSRSTSSASDTGTPPTYGYHIATVTVVNGASSIANGSIADTRSQATVPTTIAGAAWTAWTPTFTNLTVGNGTHASYYQQIGKTVNFRMVFTLGSTSSMGTDPQFSLPVTAASYNSATMMARSVFQDTGTKVYFGDCYLVSTTAAKFYRNIADVTDVYAAAVNASNPHVWASTDIITCTGCYEAA